MTRRTSLVVVLSVVLGCVGAGPAAAIDGPEPGIPGVGGVYGPDSVLEMGTEPAGPVMDSTLSTPLLDDHRGCSVTPEYPHYQYVENNTSGSEWWGWGRARVENCRSTEVKVCLAEELDPGHWHASGCARYVKPPNGQATSARVYFHCPQYKATGRTATYWRIDEGTPHRSTQIAYVPCR